MKGTVLLNCVFTQAVYRHVCPQTVAYSGVGPQLAKRGDLTEIILPTLKTVLEGSAPCFSEQRMLRAHCYQLLLIEHLLRARISHLLPLIFLTKL